MRGYIAAVIFAVAIAHSKRTAQGHVSMPATVRRKLGVDPGSVLEWADDGEKVLVRRAGRYTSEDGTFDRDLTKLAGVERL